MTFNWVCPYCNKSQTVVSSKTTQNHRQISFDDQSEGSLLIIDTSICCANPVCQRTTISLRIVRGRYTGQRYIVDAEHGLFDQRLMPQGAAKPQPSYIPSTIVEDYAEACLIRDLSPKASATLIRRCIQGMIRDFAKISKSRLVDEIDALRKAVDDGSADRSISSESIEAIDAVRNIGNIGAHMERDINEIIEVDPGEAQALIELAEMLFDEWYGAREKRKQRLTNVLGIADDKKAAKSSATRASPSVVNALLGIDEGVNSDDGAAAAE